MRENSSDLKGTVLGNSSIFKETLFSKDILKKTNTMDGDRVVYILANTKMVFITVMGCYQPRIAIIKDISIEDYKTAEESNLVVPR